MITAINVKFTQSPYHTILGHHGLDLLRTTLRPIKMAQCASLAEWEGRIESVSRCRWCAAAATFLLAVCVCVVCARDKDGRLKGLCPLFYELGLYVGFLWGCALLIVPEQASSVIPKLARTRGPGPLKPGSNGI